MSALSPFALITLLLWIVCYGWLAIGGKTAVEDIAVHAQKPGARVIKLAMMLLLYAVLYFPQLFRLPPPDPSPNAVAASLGVLLAMLGVAMVLWSRRTLGRNWSDLVVLKADHKLVATGPYRWVRHPLYAGCLLAFLGSALTLGVVSAWIIFLIAFFGFATKARAEEKLLTGHFPDSYPAYRRRIKAFIPYLL